MLDNRIGRNRLVVDLPTIIVCHQTNCHKRDFRFAGEFCFRHVGHADYVEPHFSMELGLSSSRESWTVHIDVSSAVMHSAADGPSRLCCNCSQLVTYRIGKGDVGHDTFAKKCPGCSLTGSIKELRG